MKYLFCVSVALLDNSVESVEGKESLLATFEGGANSFSCEFPQAPLDPHLQQISCRVENNRQQHKQDFPLQKAECVYCLFKHNVVYFLSLLRF